MSGRTIRYMDLFGMWISHHFWRGDRVLNWLNPISLLLVVLLFAFEFWMFVDVITNKKVPSQHKVLWVIGMLLLHPFVAIAYFYLSRSGYYKKRKA